MNLNGDEKTIRQLFGDMRSEEERQAPEFARFVAVANSRARRSQQRKRLFAFAWAISGLAIAVLIALSFALRHSPAQPEDSAKVKVEELQPVETTGPVTATTTTIHSVVAPPSINHEIRHKPAGQIQRPRRHVDELAISMKSLAAWRSPTASLMKPPTEEIFKSLPRLGESLNSIRIFTPDDFN